MVDLKKGRHNFRIFFLKIRPSPQENPRSAPETMVGTFSATCTAIDYPCYYFENDLEIIGNGTKRKKSDSLVWFAILLLSVLNLRRLSQITIIHAPQPVYAHQWLLLPKHLPSSSSETHASFSA